MYFLFVCSSPADASIHLLGKEKIKFHININVLKNSIHEFMNDSYAKYVKLTSVIQIYFFQI
jgi:hypothetical protein